MNSKKLSVRQYKICGTTKCPWHCDHPAGKVFEHDEILPQNICPWLYHTVYPYFLGLLYGARFKWNEKGDCQVCCPSPKGVNVIVRKRDNDGSFDPRIADSMKFVIFAEVVDVLGSCDFGHKIGERLVFPTCMMKYYLCPAGFHGIFPLMKLSLPACLRTREVRCPDWADTITYGLPDVIE
jgi:uncharacterized repeat protein (TIGR04076 family)